MLAFDNRGTGLSAKPEGMYTVEQLADDAASVLDARGLPSADVYGHSLGGFIALTLAVRRPDLVRSLVLVGTGPGGPDHEPLPQGDVGDWQSVVGLPLEEAIRRTMPTSFAPGWIEAHPDAYESYLQARLDPPTPPRCWWAQLEAGRAYVETVLRRADHAADARHPRRARPRGSGGERPPPRRADAARRARLASRARATCRCSSRPPSSRPSRAPFSTDLTQFQCLALGRKNCVADRSVTSAQDGRDGRYWAYSSSIVVRRVRVWSASSGA